MSQFTNPEVLNKFSVHFKDQSHQEHNREEAVGESHLKGYKIPIDQCEANTRHLSRRSKGYDTFRSNEVENFTKTSSKLFERSFSHHNPKNCVCEQCNCGRHLCDFKNNLKPDLRKTTIYQQNYEKKTPVLNRVNRPAEYNKFSGPHIDLASNYQKEYDGKQGDINHKVRPEDELKTGGPSNFLTSYSSEFPGHRGANQYIKPIERSTIVELPLMSNTTYMRSFMPRSTERSKIQKTPDNLRTNNMWMGRSTYNNFYRHPNPEDYAKKNKIVEKLNDAPNFQHQYETTYGKSFMGSMPTICPAKATLETRSKGFFSCSKETFTENTDYKSLDPTFHAISTSKHSHV